MLPKMGGDGVGIFACCVILLLCAVNNVNSYSKYGRGCQDIGCLPSEECVITQDSCSYTQREGKDCGSYPTCKKKYGASPSSSSVPVNPSAPNYETTSEKFQPDTLDPLVYEKALETRDVAPTDATKTVVDRLSRQIILVPPQQQGRPINRPGRPVRPYQPYQPYPPYSPYQPYPGPVYPIQQPPVIGGYPSRPGVVRRPRPRTRVIIKPIVILPVGVGYAQGAYGNSFYGPSGIYPYPTTGPNIGFPNNIPQTPVRPPNNYNYYNNYNYNNYNYNNYGGNYQDYDYYGGGNYGYQDYGYYENEIPQTNEPKTLSSRVKRQAQNINRQGLGQGNGQRLGNGQGGQIGNRQGGQGQGNRQGGQGQGNRQGGQMGNRQGNGLGNGRGLGGQGQGGINGRQGGGYGNGQIGNRQGGGPGMNGNGRGGQGNFNGRQGGGLGNGNGNGSGNGRSNGPGGRQGGGGGPNGRQGMNGNGRGNGYNNNGNNWGNNNGPPSRNYGNDGYNPGGGYTGGYGTGWNGNNNYGNDWGSNGNSGPWGPPPPPGYSNGNNQWGPPPPPPGSTYPQTVPGASYPGATYPGATYPGSTYPQTYPAATYPAGSTSVGTQAEWTAGSAPVGGVSSGSQMARINSGPNTYGYGQSSTYVNGRPVAQSLYYTINGQTYMVQYNPTTGQKLLTPVGPPSAQYAAQYSVGGVPPVADMHQADTLVQRPDGTFVDSDGVVYYTLAPGGTVPPAATTANPAGTTVATTTIKANNTTAVATTLAITLATTARPAY